MRNDRSSAHVLSHSPTNWPTDWSTDWDDDLAAVPPPLPEIPPGLPLLARDQRERPDLFWWRGSLELQEIRRWSSEVGVTLPSELLELWAATGGGDFLGAEMLLAPSDRPELWVTPWWPPPGLVANRPEHLVVHVGSCVTALRLADAKWILYSWDRGEPLAACDDLAGWYATLRDALAEQHQLSPP